jgi:hypothetical protein
LGGRKNGQGVFERAVEYSRAKRVDGKGRGLPLKWLWRKRRHMMMRHERRSELSIKVASVLMEEKNDLTLHTRMDVFEAGAKADAGRVVFSNLNR